MTSDNPVSVGDLFAFIILVGRVQGPLLQMAQLVTQYDEARVAVGIVAQTESSAAGGRAAAVMGCARR